MLENSHILSYWLFFMFLCRIMIFCLVLFKKDFVELNLYPKHITMASPLYKRLLLVWVWFGSMVTLITSYNIDDKALLQICLILHIIGYMHHMSEYYIFKTAHSYEFLTIHFIIVPSVAMISYELMTNITF